MKILDTAFLRRLATIIVLATILNASFAPHIGANSNPEVLNGIVRPRIGYPAFIDPEGSFEAKALPLEGAQIWRAFISNEFGKYELTVESAAVNQTSNLIELNLKAQHAAEGLYALELTALSAGGTVLGQYSEPNSVSVRSSLKLPSRVMYVTDIHVNNTPDRILNVRRIIRLANFLRPDFILAAGDNIDSAQEIYFPIAYRLFQELEVPIIMAPGNHDHLTEGEFFVKYFAPWYGSLDVGPVHIVTLDSGPQSIVGEISQSQLAWLSNDLAAHGQSKFKILMWHHPMFDTDDPQNPFSGEYARLGEVYRIASQYDVNLIINGHMHRDIVFHGPVLTLINSNSYEGGRPYTGFRLLTITENSIEYRYAGGEEQIPLYDFDIEYTQPNDGKSSGIIVDLANRWKMEVNGVLRLRVAYGDFVRVEGAAISRVVNNTEYMMIESTVSLNQGEGKRIVAYTRTDNEPPIVELMADPKIEVGPTVIIVEFQWRIIDSVLGLKTAEMYYSTDNKTWMTLPLFQVEPRTFWARAQFEKTTGQVFYYAAVSDAAGHGTTSSTFSTVLAQTQIPIQPQLPSNLITTLLMALAIVTAGVIAALYLRKIRRR